MEQQRSALENYFKHHGTGILNFASSIVVDKATNQLVAACLISLWEDLPLISNIAVIPEYRGKQIASNLIKKALTILNKEYEVLRLFVSIGNSAESVYYNLGFFPGLEQTTFYLPPRNI